MDITMNNCLALLFAHEESTSLSPLTSERVSAAIPFAGKYRGIDFPLTNCLHSGIRNILVFTHQKHYSLQKHLRDGWSVLNPELGEYITVVPPQLTISSELPISDYSLIEQQLYLLERSETEYVILLNGAHIYRMDYTAMLDAHIKTESDITLACTNSYLTASNSQAVTINESNRITALETEVNKDGFTSMDVMICNRIKLIELLKQHGKELAKTISLADAIVSRSLNELKIHAYNFCTVAGRVSQDNYWANFDSLETYYQANMDLLNPTPSIDIYQKDWHIRTYQQQTPPARTVPDQYANEGIFINSILAGGSIIEGGSVQQSILFPNVYVGSEAFVENSIVFEQVRIEAGARIKNCIIEKHNCIPRKEVIGHDLEQDRKRFQVTDKGIVIVPPRYTFK